MATKIYVKGLAEGITDVQFTANDIDEIEMGKSFFHEKTAQELFPNSYSGIQSVTLLGTGTDPALGNAIAADAFKGCTGLQTFYVESLTAWTNCELGNEYSNPCYYSKNIIEKGESNSITSIVANDFIPNAQVVRNYAFINCQSLQSVILPNTITTIGGSAFEGCSALTWSTSVYPTSQFGGWTIQLVRGYLAAASSQTTTELDLSAMSNVKGLLPYAFKGNTSITKVTLANPITELPYECFSGCTALATVLNSDDVIKIGGKAFQGCTSLVTYSISESATYIGDSSFNGCTVLETAVVSDTVTYLGDNAFAGCAGLKNISISQQVLTKGWRSVFSSVYRGYVWQIDFLKFGYDIKILPEGFLSAQYIPTARTIEIGDSVEVVGDYAFDDPYDIIDGVTIDITFGKSVHTLGTKVLYGPYTAAPSCWWNPIKFRGNCPTSLGDWPLGGTSGEGVVPSSTVTIHVPSNSTGWDSLEDMYYNPTVYYDQLPIS